MRSLITSSTSLHLGRLKGEFALCQNCNKQLIVQGLKLYTKRLNELVEFCKWIKNTEENFHDKGDDTHSNKKSN